MRVLWAKAPFVLRHHPAVLAAIVLLSALVALAASSPPLVRAGVASESLKSQLRYFSPLAAGLDVTVRIGTTADDVSRRAAAARFAQTVPYLGQPVVASSFYAQVAGVSNGNGLTVRPMARTGAIAHVHHDTKADGPGVWISNSTATALRLRPGDTLPLTAFGRSAVVRLRVAGIYRELDADQGNPYWQNWVQDIRALSPDSPPPSQFVLMSEPTFEHIARLLTATTQNRFEFPVDPSRITLVGAKKLSQTFSALDTELRFGKAGVRLGCNGSRRLEAACTTTSLLSSALLISERDVAGVSPTVSLLSDSSLLISLGLCVAAGVFLVRRRRDEALTLFARGESPMSFATRSGLETFLPATTGAAIGLGVALLALSTLAPGGTIGGSTISSGGLRAAAAAALAIVCIALGVALAYPRSERPARRHVRVPPWELAPLAAAIALLVIVLMGSGLVHDSTGASYPRLEVFLLPVLAVAAIAGLATRVARVLLRARREPRRAWLLLPLRRLGAARGLLVAVVVATAAAAGSFAYASTLSASLSRSTAEKAYVANGSDVQAFVDPHFKLYTRFAFPLALVEVDELDVTLPSGQPVDLIAGDPAALARTLHGWQADPRPLLVHLAHASPRTLAVIATPGAPHITSIVDQGAHIPVDVVGHAIIPGVSGGRPGVLVSRAALRRFARRDNFLEPAPSATGLLWARGDVRTIEAAIVPSNLEPAYLTTPAHIYDDPSVAATERSYRYVRLIGAAAALLSLVALLLYLQARQQAQLIATALTRRMGLTQRQDLFALALEASAIVAFAAVVGAVIATAAARPIVHHVDGLAAYAPSPAYVVPWTVLVVAVAVGIAAAALLGAVAVAIASRSDAAEELRVA
jgi:hypothetical protein